jgi:hypothetical protein
MRSNTCGGGPSIDSKATVEPFPLPLLAIAYESLAAPPPAQPPSAQAIASSAAAIAARPARYKSDDAPLITPSDIVKMH